MRRVLVVEDDPADAFLAKCPLCAVGLDVDMAVDSDEAIDKLFQNSTHPKEPSYVLVFVDLRLQKGSSGIDVLKKIRVLAPTLPVYVMTGADPGDRLVAEALELGPVGFIKKPLQKSDPIEIFQKHRLPIPVPPADQGPCI